MKKYLAVMISTMIMSGVAHSAELYNKDGNKLDLYGKLDGLHYFSGDRSKDGDQSYTRFGFKGETQINEQLIGYGQWEYQANLNHTENEDNKNFTRLGFAGLKLAGLGSFDYGRNYGVLYDIGAWTDQLPEFGNDSYESSDNFMTGRANGVATYRNDGLFGLVDGLSFALQYQGKNDGCGTEFTCADGGKALSNNARDELANQNGDGLGLSAIYDFGLGISAGAAYTSSNRTSEQKKDGLGGKADAWTAGLKYDANSIYLAANYTQTRNMTWFDIAGSSAISKSKIVQNKDDDGAFANKTDNVEVVAQYQFDNGLRPSLAYLQSRAKGIEGFGDFDLVKYADVGATYNFNKNMSAYVDYKINLLKSDNPAGLNTDNIVATGLVYQF